MSKTKWPIMSNYHFEWINPQFINPIYSVITFRPKEVHEIDPWQLLGKYSPVFTLDLYRPCLDWPPYWFWPASPFMSLSYWTSNDDKVRNLSLISILTWNYQSQKFLIRNLLILHACIKKVYFDIWSSTAPALVQYMLSKIGSCWVLFTCPPQIKSQRW